jgi:hypothetical protein
VDAAAMAAAEIEAAAADAAAMAATIRVGK